MDKQPRHTPGEGAQGIRTGQETTGTAQGTRDGDAAQHAGAGLDAAGTAQYSDTGAAAQHSRRMKRGEVRPGSAWALVTGAGSGIGRCYALRLAALGYRLVIVGNNAAPLEAVAGEIRSAAGASASATGTGRAEIPAAGTPTAGTSAAGTTTTGTSAAGIPAEGTQTAGTPAAGTIEAPATPTRLPEVRVMPMDLARVGAAQELYDRTAAEGIEIDVVINNAGIFSFCDILTTPAERIERIVLLHDLTVSQLCRLYAADMVRRGVRGHILNMSSYSLWMPFPGLALYSASKAYMRSFSVAFAKEVRERGIRVTAVCPAGVATDLYGLTPRWQRIGKRLGVLITPDNCARKGLRALWRGRRCIVPDWWNRAWIPLCKALPMWALRPIRRFTMRFQK